MYPGMYQGDTTTTPETPLPAFTTIKVAVFGLKWLGEAEGA